MTEFISKFDLKLVSFDGCSVGVKDPDGNPMRKPWTIATDVPEIYEAFVSKKCHCAVDHVACEGSLTKGTERYTDRFAELVHEAWRKHVVRNINMATDPAAPAADGANKEYPNMPRQPPGYPHRNKRGHWPIMNAAVARTVKSAELAVTPKAREALA